MSTLALLTSGELTLEGRLRGASNTTLRGTVSLDGVSSRCVYKPVSGERPLWDFPDGTLAAREVAAYAVCAATGWDLVPPTVLRDGPLGPGACQQWIDTRRGTRAQRVGFVPADAVPDGWHPVVAAADDDGTEYVLAHADDEALARLALFDAVINNADRKGGHVLPARDGSLRGIDHGVSFHVEEKLRTVLWGFAGRPIPDSSLAVLTGLGAALAGPLGATLGELLAPEEVEMTAARVARLLAEGVYPAPAFGRRSLPWPPI